jgi:hypothetical protein
MFSDIINEKFRVFTEHKENNVKRGVNYYLYDLNSRKIDRHDLFTAEVFDGYNARNIEKERFINKWLNIELKKSEDSGNICFIVENSERKKNGYGIRVFDEELNELFRKEHVFEDYERKFLNDFLIMDKNQVFTICKVVKQGVIAGNTGDQFYEFILSSISEDKIETETLDINDNRIDELKMFRKKRTLNLVGFYSEDSSKKMKGITSFGFDPEDISSFNVKEYPFTTSMFQDLYRDGKAERMNKKEKELTDYVIDYYLEDSSGNNYLCAEQFYITGNTSSTEYHFDNIIITKFDSNGELVWSRALLKRNYAPNYKPVLIEDEFYIFLNNSSKLIEKSDGRKYLGENLSNLFSKQALYAIHFSANEGDMHFDQLMENRGFNSFKTYLGEFSNGKFIVPNTKKKEKSFLIISKR